MQIILALGRARRVSEKGKSTVSDIVLLTAEYLVLFKVKARLDFAEKIQVNPAIF